MIWSLTGSATADPLRVETYDHNGITKGAQDLYFTRRALVYAAPNAHETRADRQELIAWLIASGFEVDIIDHTDPLGEIESVPLSQQVDDWLSHQVETQTQLLLVLDGQLNRRDGQEYIEAPGTPEPGQSVQELLLKVSNSRSIHTLVALSDPINRAPTYEVMRGTSGSVALRDEDLGKARVVIMPRRQNKGAAFKALSSAFRGDLGRFFDPDAYITVRDLFGRYGDRIDVIHGDGTRRGGRIGNPVIALRDAFEPALDGVRSFSLERRDAEYTALLRALEPQLFDSYLSKYENATRDAKWVAARLAAVRVAQRTRAAHACDSELTFSPDPLLDLGVSVIGKIETIVPLEDLARSWLASIRSASGMEPMQIGRLLSICNDGGPAPPDRAFRMALLMAGDPEREPRAVDLIAMRLIDEGRLSSGAARLGGLIIIAARAGDTPNEGLETFGKAITKRLEQDSGEGDSAAKLVLGLLKLSSRGAMGEPATLATASAMIGEAASIGLPVAHGLYGALMLSNSSEIAVLRNGVAVDGTAAYRSLEIAERAGLKLAPRLVDLAALRAEQHERELAACVARLDFSAQTLFDPWVIRSQADMLDAIQNIHGFLDRTLKTASFGYWRQVCRPVLERGAIPDQLALRVAIIQIKERDTETALRNIQSISDGEPTAAFLEAAIASGMAQKERLSALAKTGHPLSMLYLTMLEAGGHGETSDYNQQIASLAAQGLPLAQFVEALRFFQNQNPFDLVRSAVWLKRAQKAGFVVDKMLEDRIMSEAGKEIPRDLGLTLGMASRADWRRYHPMALQYPIVPIVRTVAEHSPAWASGLKGNTIIDGVGWDAAAPDLLEIGQQMLSQVMERHSVMGKFYLPLDPNKTVKNIVPSEDLVQFLKKIPKEFVEVKVKNAKSSLKSGPGGVFLTISDLYYDDKVVVLSKKGKHDWLLVRHKRGDAEIDGYIRHDDLAY